MVYCHVLGVFCSNREPVEIDLFIWSAINQVNLRFGSAMQELTLRILEMWGTFFKIHITWIFLNKAIMNNLLIK